MKTILKSWANNKVQLYNILNGKIGSEKSFSPLPTGLIWWVASYPISKNRIVDLSDGQSPVYDHRLAMLLRLFPLIYRF